MNETEKKEISIKKNFIYKCILTLSSYLVGFIVYPYISRILGVEKVGLVNFIDNTVNYFLLFATLGVNVLGVREIAVVKNDLEKRCQVFQNILGLNILFTVVVLILYWVVVHGYAKFALYTDLFYIGIAKIISTAFLVEWFFTGIEDFRYITIRSIFVKSGYVITVFLLVRNPDDYFIYLVLTMGVVVFNALINWFYVRRSIRFQLRELFSMKYLKTDLVLGCYSIMTSMYLTFNVMFLGLQTNNVEVGYYTTAFKLYAVVLGIFSAFTNVMLPRMSAVLGENNYAYFRQLIHRSFSLLFIVSIPLIIYTVMLAPQIIYVFSGEGYEGAILPMRMIMPLVLVVGIAQVLAIQFLMPMRKDKILFIASLLGAMLSLLMNVLVVPLKGSVGSALVLVCAESVVTLFYIMYVWRNYFRIPVGELSRYMLKAFPCIAICWGAEVCFLSPFAVVGVAGTGVMAYVSGMLYIGKKRKTIRSF